MIVKAKYELPAMTRGGDYDQLLDFKQPDGTAWDMTGCTVTAECRETTSRDSVKLFDFDTDNSELSAGRVRLQVARAETELISVSGYAYWRLSILGTDGMMFYYVSGRIPIED